MKALISTLGLLLVTACGAAQSTTTSAPLAAAVGGGSVTPGTFKMYKEPHHKPVPGCDVYTKLQLINGFAAPVAVLENKVDGSCEIFVAPAKRVYNLTETDYGCGSKRYVGKKSAAGDASSIEVIDHRTRVCRDIQPAKIIVKETNDKGVVTTLYSYDALPAAVKASGKLVGLMAIGGETTGYGLETADGTVVELDLATHGLAAAFAEGKRVTVKGVTKQVHGVEIPVRDVLEVTEIALAQ